MPKSIVEIYAMRIMGQTPPTTPATAVSSGMREGSGEQGTGDRIARWNIIIVVVVITIAIAIAIAMDICINLYANLIGCH